MIKPAKLNPIDKIVNYFSPTLGARRQAARNYMALSGSYTGASSSRRSLSEWTTSVKSPDSDILGDLPTLRDRSRDLVRNNPLACGAINTACTNVVGSGLTLQSRIDRDVLPMSDEEADAWETKTEREFRLWAESFDCDISRKLNFYDSQELAFRQVLENGDVFILMPRIKRNYAPYNLRLQMIEADRVCNEQYAADSNTLSGGIEKDSNGAPVRYHILEQHPGSYYQTDRTWKKIPAYGKNTGLKNVIHLFITLRPGQTRGVPYLAPVMETIKQLGRYTDAEIMAAVVSGFLTVFVKSEGNGFSPMAPISEIGGSASDDDYKLGNGAIIDLAPGESIDTVTPGRPNAAFDPFFMAVVRQIGVALEIPFEILIKHFTASYSASRAAMLEAWKFFIKRRRWLAQNYCQQVYEIWMHEAVSLGRIKAPGFFRDPVIRKAYLGADWTGPAKGMIDETKEVQAAEKRIELGLTSRSYEAAQLLSLDYEKVHKQTLKENKMRQELAPQIKPEEDNESDKPTE